MNPNMLLDYQLGQLDAAERARVESALKADSTLAAKVDRLGTSLRWLLDDGDGPEPPPGLAARALTHVAASRATLPMRPDWVPVRVRFRPADLAVAATIFLAAAATMVPAVTRVRTQATIAKCANNLRDLGTVLGSFASAHGHFPYEERQKPLRVSMSEMVTDGAHDASVLACPSNQGGIQLASIRARSPIDEILKQLPDGAQAGMNHGYAFHVGHRNGSGEPTGAVATGSLIPIVADPPRLIDLCRVAEGNSPSHNGGGQNALFADLHVRWLPERRWHKDQDIYKNRLERCSYGLDERDAALMPLLMPMDE